MEIPTIALYIFFGVGSSCLIVGLVYLWLKYTAPEQPNRYDENFGHIPPVKRGKK